MAAGSCRREVPVSLRLDDETMVEGIVDLAFQDQLAGGDWVIVDYKTDFEMKGRLEEYRNQVWLYAQAVSHATASKTHPVLLRI